MPTKIYAGGLGVGGAVSPMGSRGSAPENFENLVPLDARKLLFQHAFSGYSAALKRSRNSNIHVKPHCWRQNLTLFMDKLTSWIYCWCVTPWGGETVPTKHGWMDVSCDIKNTMTFLMLHKINLKSNVKINFLSFKIKKLDFKFLWDQSFCSTPLL